MVEEKIIPRVGKVVIRSKKEEYYLQKAEKIFRQYEERMKRIFERALIEQRRHGTTMTAQHKDLTVNGLDILTLLV